MSKLICDELKRTLNENNSNVIVACDAVLGLILSKCEEEQKTYFETFLKELSVSDIETDDFEEFFSLVQDGNILPKQNEVDQLGARIIGNLIKKNVSEREFYNDLWNRLMDDILSEDRESKTILLVRFWLDPRTPYYQLSESCIMDNDEYHLILNTIETQLKKARFIIHAGLPQKTQKASLLMDLADEIEDYRTRAVFWTVALDQEALLQLQTRKGRSVESVEAKE